jgi:hypothetical protein
LFNIPELRHDRGDIAIHRERHGKVRLGILDRPKLLLDPIADGRLLIRLQRYGTTRMA